MPGHNLGMRRLAFLLAAFLAAGASARAATVPPLPDADRTNTYAVSAPTAAFPVPFAVYGDCSDLLVYENGTILSPQNYTCASASGQTQRPIADMVITLAAPLSAGTLQILGDYRPRNLAMPTAPGITRYEFNRTINTILAGMRETRAKADQATPPQLYGFWDPGTYYPTNAVVGFGGQEYEATQGNVNQAPSIGSPYWQVVLTPPQQVTFNTPTLPGAPLSILAAPSVDIGTAATHFVNITGSGATISDFGSSCSASAPIYYVTFAGSDVLVQSGALILPGYANVTTAPNDAAVVQCLGGGSVKVVGYLPFSQPPGFSLPSGAVLAFFLQSCPAGWVTADGTNGTVDARGNAIRGLDLGVGRDPGRTIGSLQADQMQTFGVTTPVPTGQTTEGGGSGGPKATPTTTAVAGTITGSPRLGAETRMKNVALLYCQKS